MLMSVCVLFAAREWNSDCEPRERSEKIEKAKRAMKQGRQEHGTRRREIQAPKKPGEPNEENADMKKNKITANRKEGEKKEGKKTWTEEEGKGKGKEEEKQGGVQSTSVALIPRECMRCLSREKPWQNGDARVPFLFFFHRDWCDTFCTTIAMSNLSTKMEKKSHPT